MRVEAFTETNRASRQALQRSARHSTATREFTSFFLSPLPNYFNDRRQQRRWIRFSRQRCVPRQLSCVRIGPTIFCVNFFLIFTYFHHYLYFAMIPLQKVSFHRARLGLVLFQRSCRRRNGGRRRDTRISGAWIPLVHAKVLPFPSHPICLFLFLAAFAQPGLDIYQSGLGLAELFMYVFDLVAPVDNSNNSALAHAFKMSVSNSLN